MRTAYPCPCCHYQTLSARGALEVCPVCYWQDEEGHNPRDSHNIVSLRNAQLEFKEIGSSDLIWIGEVRHPLPGELPQDAD